MKSFRFQIAASTVLLVAAVMAAVVLGTQLVLVAWRVSHRALKPVRDMAERAEDWSAQNLARRFDLGPPVNELSQLGQTLDHLLDRVAHAIRTPLAAIRGSAELALLRRPTDPELRTDLAEIADGTRRLVTRALAPLVENAGQHAEQRVTMDLRARDLVEFAVSDDGPGVPPGLRESIFEPGASTGDRVVSDWASRAGPPGPWEATSFSTVMSSCCAFPAWPPSRPAPRWAT